MPSCILFSTYDAYLLSFSLSFLFIHPQCATQYAYLKPKATMDIYTSSIHGASITLTILVETSVTDTKKRHIFTLSYRGLILSMLPSTLSDSTRLFPPL
jgi:hypothetical protein